MKTFTHFLNFMSAVMVSGILFFTAISHSAVDKEIEMPSTHDQMFSSGECWIGGEGHGVPTRIMYMDGRVAPMSHALFTKALDGKVKFQAFCK